MKNVVGWLAGSLWGGKQQHPEQDAQDDDASMSDDDQQQQSASPPSARHANDDTVSYSDEEDDYVQAAPASIARAHTRQASAQKLALAGSPLQHASASSTSSPAPLFSPPATRFAGSRLSFSSVSPAQPLPAHSFGAAPVAATPASSKPLRHAQPLASPFASPMPLSSPSAASASASGAPTPDQLLRDAFAQFTHGALEQSAGLLAQLSASGGAPRIDELVQALGRRTCDSRHVLQDGAGVDEQADSIVLTEELQQKAAQFDALLAFLHQPLIAGADRQYISLWSVLSHASQYALLQQGEWIECCLRLKQLLNAVPLSFASGDGSAPVEDEADAALVAIRRQVMMECMENIVRTQRWEHGAAVLSREGASTQEIFFSETSKLAELFGAVETVVLQHAPANADAEEKASVAQYNDLMRLHAAASLLHCVMIGAADFRAAPAHASLFAELTLPRAEGNDPPSTSWLLAADVQRVVRLLSQRISEQVVALAPGVRVVGFPGAASSGRPNVSALFNVQTYQAQLFDFSFRIGRVYLSQYTEFLSLVELVRQAAEGPLSSALQEAENAVHARFTEDRGLLLSLLAQASRAMNAANQQLSAVFPIPAEGLPGVESPKLAPYQPLYDFAQEFQDLSALVNLSLEEPVRAVADRRLLSFVACYGHPFVAQLFEELLASGQGARLLELAPLAREQLPALLRAVIAARPHGAESSFGGETYLPGPSSLPQRVDDQCHGEDGLPIFDSWMAQMLKPLPHLAWIHDLDMAQYGDAHKVLRNEAHGEKQSLTHKKHLLSLSKLALLADSASATGGGEATLSRAPSDISLSTDASSSDSVGALNTNELQALDDQLFVLLAQEFVQSLTDGGRDDENEGMESSVPVLPPSELLSRLLSAGLNAAHPSGARLHAFCWAFLLLEKSLLPRSRSTTLDSFSSENRAALESIWAAIITADSDKWPAIAQAREKDSSDSWQEQLVVTQLYNVWRELLSVERNCYDHEHVYVQSCRRLLQTPKLLPPALQGSDVRSVMDSAFKLAKQQATQLQ